MNPQASFDYSKDATESSQGRRNQSSTPMHRGQNILHGEQPATPRMLRSMSGSARSSNTDINQRLSSTPTQYGSDDVRYDDSGMMGYQTPQSKSTAMQQQSMAAQYHTRTPSSTHSRTPSINRHQIPPPLPNINPQMAMASSKKSELLPPATFSAAASNEASAGVIQRPDSISLQQGSTASPQRVDNNRNQQAFHTPQKSHDTYQAHQHQSQMHQQTPKQQQQQQQQSQTPSHPQQLQSQLQSQSQSQPQPQSQQSQQQFHRKSIGDWNFVKTIGAGSMGKVKLAQHNSTGEICAVKIVPRAAKLYQRSHANDPPPANAQAAAQRQKEFEKEVARDKRTIREGALGRLLYHPYICRLYEMVPMTNHYYMLFEYIEGGQMLDYIVSHGSLKEKNARKFAREIASALDYCHKNSVVHRDLKIENIMINQKGDIKIIDFGLSNLYLPRSLLKTYCGSLYFAAPELLSAKPYTGPEVDIWSFGVVLYVLVCGKVPFDDQSVSVLHEKIKRGNVEYPSFLSKECISLLARMLVVDPLKRATLYEVSQHPWMNKGYEYGLSSYVPKRVPLTLPLDPEVIKTIATFDLGSFQSVAEELTSVLTSVEYQMSYENWYRIKGQGRDYASASNAQILPDPTCGYHHLISLYFLVSEMRDRKMAKNDMIRAQVQQQQLQQQQQQQQQQLQQQQQQQQVLEAQKKVPPTPPLPPPQEQRQVQHENSFESRENRTLDVHRRDQISEKDTIRTTASPETRYKQQMQKEVPSISFPPQAHTTTSPSNYMNEPQSPPSKDSVAQGLPEQQQSHREAGAMQETLDPNADKGTGINSLLRRISSKKSKNSPSGINKGSSASPGVSDVSAGIPGLSITQASKDNVQSEETHSSKNDPLVRRGVSMKVTAKEKSTVSLQPSRNNINSQKTEMMSTSKSKSKEQMTPHVRSSSTNQPKPHGYIPAEYLPPLPNINTNLNTTSGNSSKVAPESSGRKLHPTARAKSVGGQLRKDTYGYRQNDYSQNQPPLPNTMATQNSDELVNENNSVAFFDDVTLDDVQLQNLPQLTEGEIIEQFHNAKPNSMPSIEYPRTLFLKGFFSVQTTSTKPLPVIRYNIVRVLSNLGVKFQEVKGGFICAFKPPSRPKDLVYDNQIEASIGSQNEHLIDSNSDEKKSHREENRSTSSSFIVNEHPLRSHTPEHDYTEHTKTPSRQPSLHLTTKTLSPSSNSSTLSSHRSSNSIGGGHRRKFSFGNSILGSYRKRNGSQVIMPPNTPAAAKVNKSLYSEEDEELYEDTTKNQFTDDDSVDSLNGIMIGGGSDMLVSSRLEHKARHQHQSSVSSHSAQSKSPLNFEIYIVKVPLVGLYGVQFKKIFGNTWNYKTLAGEILNELNL